MTSAAKPRRTFKPRTVEQWHKMQDGFGALIARAKHGHTEPLCAFLRNPRRELSWQDRDDLAWLIEQTLERSQIGRPSALKPKNLAIACAGYLVWSGKREWLERHPGYRRVPTFGPRKGPRSKHGPTDALVTLAIAAVRKRFRKLRAEDISAEAVREAANLPARADVKHEVHEYMPHAGQAIIALARQL